MRTAITKMPVKAHIGYLYFPDGRIIKVRPANNRRFSFKEMQKAVDGYIEPLTPKEGSDFYALICNEEGIRLDLPPNPHTNKLVDVRLYDRNRIEAVFRLRGVVFGYKLEDFDDSLPTINQVMKKEGRHGSV
jgi:Domain of unknown function (DUF3846)